MVTDRVDLGVKRIGAVAGAPAKKIVYPHRFSLELGCGETFGGWDVVLYVTLRNGREFPFLRMGGSSELGRFFIKKFQGGKFSEYAQSQEIAEVEREFKNMRRTLGKALGIYPRKGLFLAYLMLLFLYHHTRISEVWDLCVNLGDATRSTFHVDSPIESLVKDTPGWEAKEADVLGGRRTIHFLKRENLVRALEMLSAKEQLAVRSMLGQIVAACDVGFKREAWQDLGSLLV